MLYCYYSTKRHRDHFKNHNIEIVISRYNEDLEFLDNDVFADYLPVTVYNKGPHLKSSPMYTEIRLPNVGRCDHTYLYHIVDRYYNLADVTVFLPASCFDGHKRCQTDMVIRSANATSTTVLPARYGTLNDVHKDLYDFQLSEYTAGNASNVAINPERTLQLCPDRPFGRWYTKNFPDLIKTKIRVVCYFGIFAAARKHVHNRSREWFTEYLEYVSHSSNPEAGHYMERAWGAVFYPYPKECVSELSC
jgi:hypothetical protein